MATRREMPSTPTYVFRLSAIDSDLCTVGNIAAVRDAHKKLKVGTQRHAVKADLVRKKIDPALLDLEINVPLPAHMRDWKPVMVEFTELYLDERSFMEHSGSRDYLAAYGEVLAPGLFQSPPITTRFGTPTNMVVTNILEPMLKENVAPTVPGCFVWKQPQPTSSSSAAHRPVLLSLNIEDNSAAVVSSKISD